MREIPKFTGIDRRKFKADEEQANRETASDAAEAGPETKTEPAVVGGGPRLVVNESRPETGQKSVEVAEPAPETEGPLVADVVVPLIAGAEKAFLAQLEKVTIDDLCRRADEHKVFKPEVFGADFTI